MTASQREGRYGEEMEISMGTRNRIFESSLDHHVIS